MPFRRQADAKSPPQTRVVIDDEDFHSHQHTQRGAKNNPLTSAILTERVVKNGNGRQGSAAKPVAGQPIESRHRNCRCLQVVEACFACQLTNEIVMGYKISPYRVGEALEHLFRYWEEKRKVVSHLERLSSVPQLLTIALSREAGTEGTAIGHEVGSRLGWAVYDHELLDRIAQDMGMRSSLLESVDERRMSWLNEQFEALFDVPYVNETVFAHHLVKTTLALGSHGECIIVGRGAAFILPARSTLPAA